MSTDLLSSGFSLFGEKPDKQPERIEVSPEVHALISRGDQLEEEAVRRAREKARDGRPVPVIFYDKELSEIEERERMAAEAVKASYLAGHPLCMPVEFAIKQSGPSMPEPPTLSQPFNAASTHPHLSHVTQLNRGISPWNNGTGAIYPKESAVQGEVEILPAMPRRRDELTMADLATLMKARVPLKRHNGDVYIYDGAVYQKLSPDDLVAKIYSNLLGEVERIGTPILLKGVSQFLRADERLDDTPIEDPSLLCLQNGVLDLNQMQMQAHSPVPFFTSALNVPLYDLRPKGAPVFEAFLNQVTGGNSVLRQRMLEALGYLLVPGSGVEAKAFIFIQGVGNSGKSVFGKLITDFFDPGAVSHIDIFRLGDRFSPYTLVGKRLNISMDLPSGRLGEQSVAKIKMLTGGDGIVVEKKYGEPITYYCGCKLVFGSNHPIQLTQADDALDNRMLVLPFQYAIPREHQNKCLFAQLQGEKVEILKLALDAYMNLKRNNFVFTGGMLGPVPTTLPAAMVPLEDMMARYVSRCCQQTGPEIFTTTEELHGGFSTFYLRETGDFYTGDSASFSRIFHRLAPWAQGGKKRVPQGNLNGYYGVSLVPQC